MDDLISRQAAIDAIEEIDRSDGVGLSALKCDAVDDAVATIKALPSAQKKGHWIYPTDVKGFCRCEHCGALWGRDLYENQFFKYCPRCGADMRGENE